MSANVALPAFLARCTTAFGRPTAVATASTSEPSTASVCARKKASLRMVLAKKFGFVGAGTPYFAFNCSMKAMCAAGSLARAAATLGSSPARAGNIRSTP